MARDGIIQRPPPPPNDCQICFLPLPYDAGQKVFRACYVENGFAWCSCTGEMMKDAVMKRKKKEEVAICPFCRTPHARTDNEEIQTI